MPPTGPEAPPGGDEIRFDVVDPLGPPARFAVEAYFAELDRRFPGGFDPGNAIVEDAPAYGPPSGVFVVAVDRDAATAACGGVMRFDDHTGEIKRMWVHPDHRGRGLGRAMLRTLEDHARSLGYARVVLDTNSTLVEAVAMYESAGYAAVERYNDNPYALRWFAKSLT